MVAIYAVHIGSSLDNGGAEVLVSQTNDESGIISDQPSESVLKTAEVASWALVVAGDGSKKLQASCEIHHS